VSEELELEDPKDLRAEIGKCPNSTNERKNMSTKTMKQRIAVVAVSALTAGVLSVASAPVANSFAAGGLTVTAKTALVNGGSCSISATAGAIGGVFVNGSTVQLTSATTNGTYAVLAGPAVWVSATASNGTATATPATMTPTTITDAGGANGDLYTLRLTGLGAVTITVSDSSAAAPEDVITITSVDSCASSTFNAEKSIIGIVTAAGTDSDDTTAVTGGQTWATAARSTDMADADVVTVGGVGYVRAILNDAYGADLASKPIVATTNSLCSVVVEDTNTTAGAAGTYNGSTAVMTGTGADLTVAVKSTTTGVAANCTVNLTWNGITVATKSFKMQGVPASVAVSGVTVGVKGGHGYYRVTVKDSLGNLLPNISLAASASSTETNNAASVAVVSNSQVTAATTGSASDAATGALYGVTPAVTATNLSSAAGKFLCTSKGGAAKITVRVLSSGVTYVTSAPFDVYCGGDSIDTWSISMDKATYAPGEIATLTVSSKDADGHFAQSLLALGASTSAFGGMTFVTAPTDTDKFNSGLGIKTYQLSVGTTEGSFVGTFKLTGSTDAASKTVQYKIANAAGTVSNADVLKAIVSLIASINKQIAALQKALLRR
jgi:trimeric autotransporter adhesin